MMKSILVVAALLQVQSLRVRLAQEEGPAFDGETGPANNGDATPLEGGVVRSLQKEVIKTQCVQQYSRALNAVRDGLGNHILARAISLNKKTQDYERVCTQQGCSYIGKKNQPNLIIGAGFGTTATRSLDTAFVAMGLKGEHWGDADHQLAKILGNRAGECPGVHDKDATPTMRSNGGKPKYCVPLKKAFQQGDQSCYAKLEYLFPFNFNYTKDYILDSPTAELFLDWYATYPEAKFILTSRPAKSWAKAAAQKTGNPMAALQEPCGYYMKQFQEQELHDLFVAHEALVKCVVPQHQLKEINVFADAADTVRNYMRDISEWASAKKLVAEKKFPGSKYAPLKMGKAPKAKLVSETDQTQECDAKNVILSTESLSNAASFIESGWEANENTAKTLQVESQEGQFVEISMQNLGGMMKKAAELGCEIAIVQESTDSETDSEAETEEDSEEWEVGVNNREDPYDYDEETEYRNEEPTIAF